MAILFVIQDMYMSLLFLLFLSLPLICFCMPFICLGSVRVLLSIMSCSCRFTVELSYFSVYTRLLPCSPLQSFNCVSPSVQKWEADTTCVWTVWNLPSSSSASLLCFSGEIHLDVVRIESCTLPCMCKHTPTPRYLGKDWPMFRIFAYLFSPFKTS